MINIIIDKTSFYKHKYLYLFNIKELIYIFKICTIKLN